MAELRVLVVEDDEDDFRIAQSLLSEFEGGEFALDWVRTYEDAILAIRRGGYDAFLVDYFLGRRSGLDLLCGELKGGTIAPVVIVTGQDIPQLDVEARKHGAAGYLLKRELNGEALAAAFRCGIAARTAKPDPEASWPPAPARDGRLVAVIGAKGGVGTSTVVANVAAALVKRRLTVTVLEMRAHHGSLARLLGVVTFSSISQLLRSSPDEIDHASFEAALSHHPSGLRLLAAPGFAADYCDLDAEHARAIIDAAMATSDIVVVDMPYDASAANREVMASASAVAVIIEREPLAIASAAAVVSMLHAWQVAAPIGSIIVSRGAGPEPMSIAEINAELGLRKYGAVPAAAELFYKSAVTRTPVVTAHPAHPVGRALAEIAAVLTREPLNHWRASSGGQTSMQKSVVDAESHDSAILKPPPERLTVEWPPEIRTT